MPNIYILFDTKYEGSSSLIFNSTYMYENSFFTEQIKFHRKNNKVDNKTDFKPHY